MYKAAQDPRLSGILDRLLCYRHLLLALRCVNSTRIDVVRSAGYEELERILLLPFAHTRPLC